MRILPTQALILYHLILSLFCTKNPPLASLNAVQDKYGKDYTLSDEESEEEELSDDDSDAELVTPQVDAAILRTLAKIRNKDPAVYEGGRQVFDGECASVR